MDIPPLSDSIHPNWERRFIVKTFVSTGEPTRAPKDGIFFTDLESVEGLFGQNDGGVVLYVKMKGHPTPERCACGIFHTPTDRTYDVFFSVDAAKLLNVALVTFGPNLERASQAHKVAVDTAASALEAVREFIEFMQAKGERSSDETVGVSSEVPPTVPGHETGATETEGYPGSVEGHE